MKVLIDTSVWIDHLKKCNRLVESLLSDEKSFVLTHQMVMGELMLGGVKKESEVMECLRTQKTATEASPAEMFSFIAERDLANKGIGYVDCCLLASCVLSDAALFTNDMKLTEKAKDLGIKIIREEQ